jgi:hypothetical protein
VDVHHATQDRYLATTAEGHSVLTLVASARGGSDSCHRRREVPLLSFAPTLKFPHLLLLAQSPPLLLRRLAPLGLAFVEVGQPFVPLLGRVVQGNGDSTGAYFADVNGDALPDIVWSFDSTTLLFGFETDAGVVNRTPAKVRAVYLNTGSGFVKDGTRTASLHDNPDFEAFIVDSQPRGYDLLDINGDGLSDIIRTLASADRVVFLNNGAGWARDDGYTASLMVATGIVSLDSDSKGQGLLPIDLDGDGLLDYIRADESTTVAYVNTGTGFRTDDHLTQNLLDLGVTLAGRPRQATRL